MGPLHTTYVQSTMKSAVKILTWTLVLTGVIALPFLLRRRAEIVDQRSMNVRYDINDYLSDLEA